jgi:CRISPR-associated endonuclease/helicase Cas3
MVSDATTIDSLVQRLGRVNRRGWGNATVMLVREPVKMKDVKPVDLKGLDLAIANTLQLIKEVKEVSPKDIATLRSGEWKDKYAAACSPDVSTVELTDILLDAWSMTSITGPMPGRPEVGPWLRGIDNEQAQTTVAWRVELELFSDDPEKSLRAVFIKHPIRAHESLTVNTGHLLDFLKRVAKLKDRPSDLMSTRVAVRLPRGHVVCRTLQQLTDEPGILYADSTLVLPARFGGLDNSGMLDAESIPKRRTDGDAEPPSLDVADHDGYEQVHAVRSRLRVLIKRSEDGSWTLTPLPGGSIPDDIHFEEVYPTSTVLFKHLKDADLRVRLRQPIRFDDEDVAVESIVLLAPAPAKKDNEDQLLTCHVAAVQAEAGRIADTLGLAEDDPVRIALLFAAKWHDEGKKARIWQVFANNPNPDGVPLGKTARSRDPKSLRRYRHEFGSLLRIHHPERYDTTDCELPSNADARELALHLIATHHGMARPHFSIAIYHKFTDAERDAIHSASIRRFARLQRKYGWWHLAWLENLLRCADSLASADPDSEDEPADADGNSL